MHTSDKLKIIDSINTTPSIISVSNQSFKVLFPCGCYFIQHANSGKDYNEKFIENNPLKFERLIQDRFFFVEICEKHEK